MKKALMYASVASMIDLFNMDNINILQELGYTVDVACNFDEGSITSDERVEEFKQELEKRGIKCFNIPIPRDVKKINEIKKSYIMTKELTKNNYNLVHCHSPIGSVICRLAFRNTRTRMIYTAHGFHFFKGAPLKNWIIFYPIERWMARYTDVLITINQEDFERAKSFHVREKVANINGIGIDAQKFKERGRSSQNVGLRKKLNLPLDTIIIASVGQLSKRKNHGVVIKALKEINNPKIIYLIVGEGEERNNLTQLVREYKLNKQVLLLGYRSDVNKILRITDIFMFPSLQEGLPVSLMEAMATGLPCIVSDVRGNRDLIDQEKGGFVVNKNEDSFYAQAISRLMKDVALRKTMGDYNETKIREFSKERINKKMFQIYMSY